MYQYFKNIGLKGHRITSLPHVSVGSCILIYTLYTYIHSSRRNWIRSSSSWASQLSATVGSMRRKSRPFPWPPLCRKSIPAPQCSARPLPVDLASPHALTKIRYSEEQSNHNFDSIKSSKPVSNI